jgi:hypothetical protein
MDQFDEYVKENRDRFLVELQGMLRQPSVTAQNLGTQEVTLRSKLGEDPKNSSVGACLLGL